jgi:hypothetical protein
LQSVAAEDKAQRPTVAPSSSKIVGDNRITRQGREAARALTQQLDDPAQWAALKGSQIMTRFSRWNRAWLLRFQQQGGFGSLNATLTWLIENSRREDLILPASLKLLFHDERPVCLAGPSGSGKSLTLKRFLPEIAGPLFLVDLANEHTGLKKIGVGEFFEIKWGRASPDSRLKFVPSANLDVSKGELRTIFSHLNMIKMESHSPEKFPSGILSTWTIIVEEAHRLVREPAFSNFLAEGRKFTKKIIVIASDPSLYGSICTLLKPRSLLPAVIQDVPFGFFAFVATFFALFVFYSAFSLGFLRLHIDSDN